MPDPIDWKKLLSGGEEEEEEEAGNLAALVGRTVLDLNTRFFGVVKTRVDRRTGQRAYWLSGEGGRAQNLNIGATLVDPNTRQVVNVDPAGGVESGGKLSDSDIERLFGGDGGGGTAPAYSGTAAGIEHRARLEAAESARQRTWQQEQERLNREWQEEQNRLAEQNRIREQRLGVARSLAETATLAQQRAQQAAVDIAPHSPMRFTALLRGQPMRSGAKTPYDVFKKQLVGTAQQEIPSLTGEEDIATLDNLIAKLQGMQEVPQRPIGFAKGGVIGSGGSTGKGVLVGEEGPEVLELMPEGGVRVIPLVGAGAEGFESLDFGGFEDLFKGLRKSVGVPETLSRYIPRYGPTTGMGRTWRSRLGVVTGAPAPGPSATPRPFQALGSPIGIRAGLAKMGMPYDEAVRMADLIGLLPALHKAAPFIQSLTPGGVEYNTMLDAYGLAMGMSPTEFEAGITKPLVRGGPRQAITGLR